MPNPTAPAPELALAKAGEVLFDPHVAVALIMILVALAIAVVMIAIPIPDARGDRGKRR